MLSKITRSTVWSTYFHEITAIEIAYLAASPVTEIAIRCNGSSIQKQIFIQLY